MRVVASPDVSPAVQAQGGKLYVWARTGKCCMHGLAWLEAGPSPKPGVRFDSVPAEGFELFLARMAVAPEELHLDVHGRRRKRVAAYWDGCAYVT